MLSMLHTNGLTLLTFDVFLQCREIKRRQGTELMPVFVYRATVQVFGAPQPTICETRRPRNKCCCGCNSHQLSEKEARLSLLQALMPDDVVKQLPPAR